MKEKRTSYIKINKLGKVAHVFLMPAVGRKRQIGGSERTVAWHLQSHESMITSTEKNKTNFV